jgi:hypothetical protein
MYIDDKALNPDKEIENALEILELKKKIISLGGGLKNE